MLITFLLLLWQAVNPVSLEAATVALREHRFADVLTITQQLLAARPTDATLWTIQGLAHAGLQDQQSALQDLRHAVSLSPDYLPALKAEAQIEYAAHDEKCSATLRHIAELQPTDPVSHAMLAAMAYQHEDCPAVAANYRVSEAYISSQPAALSEYGQCLFQTGERAKAIELFGNVLSLQPSSEDARYNLALAELLQNRASEALGVVEPLLSSNDPRILDLASGIYEQMGNTPKAVEVLQKAIISAPSTSSLYLHFADLCFAHNSFQVGIDMLNVGLRRVPSSAQLYLARGILLVQLGKYAEAEKDFDHAAEIDPSQSYSSVAHGLTQLQLSNLEGALSITRAQLERNPKDGYLWYVKAETLRQKGVSQGTVEFREAFEAAQKALELRPQFPLAEDLLGSFYLQRGEYGPALNCFRRLLEAEPNNESALYHVIVASRRNGNSEAIPDLMKRLAQAKLANRKREEETNRYTFVEPGKR